MALTQTRTEIGDGARQDFTLPPGAIIQTVKVNGSTAPYTLPFPYVVRITTPPPAGQSVDIAYVPPGP